MRVAVCALPTLPPLKLLIRACKHCRVCRSGLAPGCRHHTQHRQRAAHAAQGGRNSCAPDNLRRRAAAAAHCPPARQVSESRPAVPVAQAGGLPSDLHLSAPSCRALCNNALLFAPLPSTEHALTLNCHLATVQLASDHAQSFSWHAHVTNAHPAGRTPTWAIGQSCRGLRAPPGSLPPFSGLQPARRPQRPAAGWLRLAAAASEAGTSARAATAAAMAAAAILTAVAATAAAEAAHSERTGIVAPGSVGR